MGRKNRGLIWWRSGLVEAGGQVSGMYVVRFQQANVADVAVLIHTQIPMSRVRHFHNTFPQAGRLLTRCIPVRQEDVDSIKQGWLTDDV